jgi:acetyltransferase
MGEADVQEGIEVLQRNRIPHYQIPESIADAFSCVVRFHNGMSQSSPSPVIFNDVNAEKAKMILDEAVQQGRDLLTEDKANEVLKNYGIPTLSVQVATSPEEAKEAADKIGYPVVMKVVSQDIAHKTDVGGIVLHINSSDEAGEAYSTIIKNVKRHLPDANVKGVLVAPMISGGEEVILGMKRDLSFGPVLMFGMGGILVEVYRDVSFRVAPVSPEEATSMIEQIQGYPLLTDFRGRKAKDIEMLKECIMRLSQLVMECPQIKELDINPLIVLEEGCYVADAKIMV